MAKKLKTYYDLPYIDMLSDKILSVYPDFRRTTFRSLVEDKLETLEFNDRQVLIAQSLRQTFPLSYADTVGVFEKILGPELKNNLGMFTFGYWLWPIGKFVELYGSDDFDTSTAFTKALTKRFTGEFCMRPIVARYPEKSFKLLIEWSKDENVCVRRLSSECLRIRLPWAKKLYTALERFEDYTRVLSNLKDDPDKSVQKSVANNLNDLYKEDKNKFDAVIEQWQSSDMSDACRWVIKHASRTSRKNSDKSE